MNFKEYVTYFEDAAKSNKAVAHMVGGKASFRRIDIEEVLNGIKVDMTGLCMFLESPEIRTFDGLSDNQRKLITGAFLILKDTDKGDFAQQVDVIDECGQVAEQFVAKIVNDTRKARQDKNYAYQIKGFDPNSVSFEKVGPVFGLFYGWRVQFTINQAFNGIKAIDEAHWYDDTAFSILDVPPSADLRVVRILDQDGNVIERLRAGSAYTVTIVDAIDGGNATTVFTNTVVGQ